LSSAVIRPTTKVQAGILCTTTIVIHLQPRPRKFSATIIQEASQSQCPYRSAPLAWENGDVAMCANWCVMRHSAGVLCRTRKPAAIASPMEHRTLLVSTYVRVSSDRAESLNSSRSCRYIELTASRTNCD
jgi:hypothetical protein